MGVCIMKEEVNIIRVIDEVNEAERTLKAVIVLLEPLIHADEWREDFVEATVENIRELLYGSIEKLNIVNTLGELKK
jgi:hypothetical protein